MMYVFHNPEDLDQANFCTPSEQLDIILISGFLYGICNGNLYLTHAASHTVQIRSSQASLHPTRQGHNNFGLK